MSRSRRIAAAPVPARPPRRRVLRNERGEVRAGWLIVCALALCVAARLAVRLGLSAAFAALFAAWGLTPANVSRAPGWARFVYGWHGSAISLAWVAALAGMSIALRRRWLGKASDGRTEGSDGVRVALTFVGAGMALALLPAALFLATDSLRLEWPVSRPNLTPGLPALLLVALAGVAAEELFGKRLLGDIVRRRWGDWPAALISTAVFFAFSASIPANPIAWLNVALMGVVCARIYLRRGLGASMGFRFGWTLAEVFLLGHGGGTHAVYRLYGVSEALLTGGDAGLMYGLMTTFLLCTAIAAGAIRDRRAK